MTLKVFIFVYCRRYIDRQMPIDRSMLQYTHVLEVGSQEILGATGTFDLGIQNEAGQKLTEFCQENTLVIANTLFQQHKRWLYTWTEPGGQYQD